MTTWTDAEGTIWQLQDGKQNFNDWVVSKFAEEFTVAAEKWNAGDKSDMESLFDAWSNTTEAVKQA